MTTETITPKASKTRRRLTWLLLALPILAGAASLSVARAHGPGGGPGGGRGEMGEFMQWRMQRLLDSAGATDAQKAQIKSIWEGLRPQQKALREQHQQLRQQIETALTAPKIDTAAIEKLRQQSVQLMDKQSALFTQAMVSAAQVLSVDQRKALVEQLHRRGHRGHD
jgi:Spy/CpxP family protein refolding chaperone